MDQPSAPAPDDKGKELQAIQDSISKLGETVNTVMGRFDEFENKFSEISTPPDTTPPSNEPKWKPSTWDEFPEMAREVAKEVLTEAEQLRLQQQEDAKKQEQDVLSQIDKDFDSQLQKLESDGLIPPVKNANDPQDLGRLVRKELFALGVKYNSPDLTSMANLRNEFVSNGFSFDYKTGKILRNPSPLGATAPVGSPSGVTGGNDKPSYKEIHALSMDEMIRRFNS
ncbi:MAG TPA: hypothetical protein VJ327_00235 [Patescibacteria group bacterium]|nr:hypothetical protein [Patescibacteria group bacterium]